MLNGKIEVACRSEKEVTCCVRVYKDIWAAAIGPLLLTDPVTFSTSLFADAIAADGRLADRDPF